MTGTTPPAAPVDGKELERSGGASLPAEADRGRDDGVLDSIGKAIAAPIAGAAEAEEPAADPTKKPPVPPG